MKRMILIAAGLVAAAPGSAMAVEDAAHGVALDLRGADGVLQQGRGGGGGKDDAGARGQGDGGRQGGGNDARPSGERRQGGGQAARATERRQQPERAETGRGRSSASGSEARRGNSGSGGSDNAREERGGSSSSARGGSGSSAASRGERGNSDASSGRGASSGNAGSNAGSNASGARGGRHRLSGSDLQARVNELPPNLRRMAASSRRSERMVAGAVARSRARGVDANAFDVRDDGGRLSIFNRTGQLLLDLDDDRARDLGGWRLRRLGDRQPAANAPAFCRSGAGHPVWGREWCLDRGFGLGSRNGTIWSRGGIDDVIWRRRTDDRLDRGGLVGVLGDIVLGRLAFQAITLGYDQPLVGYWVAQPQGPRILYVNSGDYPVAELVDTNRDDRVDVLYVVQPVW